ATRSTGCSNASSHVASVCCRSRPRSPCSCVRSGRGSLGEVLLNERSGRTRVPGTLELFLGNELAGEWHRFEATQGLRRVLSAVEWGMMEVTPAKQGGENPQRRRLRDSTAT